MRLLATFLVSPLNQFILLAVAAALCQYRGWTGWSRGLWLGLAAWFVLWAVSPLPTWLVYRWESRYDALSAWPAGQPDHSLIVVLGGGQTPDARLPVNNQLSERALGRVVEAVRLYLLAPSATLVGTGYGEAGEPPMATSLMETAVALGVRHTDTLQVVRPHDTEAEARACAQRFPRNTPIVLVTDAVHMPRAIYWFRQAGFDPVAAPANHLVKLHPAEPTYTFSPSLHKLNMMHALFHEWAGMIYGRMVNG